MTLREHLEKLPGLYETENADPDIRKAVYVFTPDAQGTWVLVEYGDDLAYGKCDLGMGFPEDGYVSVSELETLRGPFGLAVEVDASIRTYGEGVKMIERRYD